MPPLARLVVWLLIRGHGSEFVRGDLEEHYATDRGAGMARGSASRRLWRQILASAWSWWRPKGLRVRLGYTPHDLRRVVRSLARRPRFALGVTLTLALGIGASTAMLSVVDGILLRPLQYPDPEGLVAVGNTFPGREWDEGSDDLMRLAGVSMANLGEVRQRSRSFASLAAFELTSTLLPDEGDGPELVPMASVAPGLFELLGARPALGRAFTANEHSVAGDGAVMLSHGTWVRRYGADPDVIGRAINRVGTPVTIVGVLPAGFALPEAFTRSVPEFWTPLQPDHARYASRGRRSLNVIGRLAPGVEVGTAREELTRIAAEVARGFPDGNVYPDGRWFGWGANGLLEETVGTSGRSLGLLLGASLLLLALASLNAGTMTLARALDRVRELSVRSALGAGRGRLAGLVMLEVLVLTGVAAVLGSVLASVGVTSLLRLAPPSLPRAAEVAVDGRVLALATGVSLLAGLAAGLLPALRSAGTSPAARLRGSGELRTTEPGARVRTALVGVQVALAMVLLSGAGLLANSFARLAATDPGFDSEGLLGFEVPLKRPGAADEALWQGWDAVLREVSMVPGIESLAGTSNPPFDDPSWAPRVLLPGDPPETWREGIAGYVVTPSYLRTAGVQLLRGRELEAGDGPDDAPVALVNEAFLDEHAGGLEAIGLTLDMIGSDDFTRRVRVVGLVENVIQARTEQGPRPAIYVPYTQAEWPSVHVLVRSDLPTESIVPGLRRAVARFGPFPLIDLQAMPDRIASTRTGPRFQATLMGAFAALALLLAVAGLSASVAHSVARRTRELGIRVALGARNGRVLRVVLARALAGAGMGLAVGLVASVGVTRALEGFLFGVRPADPATLAVVAVGLALVAGVAGLVPGWRATRVDPAVVLRGE